MGPGLTDAVDLEAELARRHRPDGAARAARTHALDHVLGYTCINDVSARDLQFADKQFVRAKSLDTFCPMGPVLVTADEIADPGALAVRSYRNGELMQDGHTSDLIFSVPAPRRLLLAGLHARAGRRHRHGHAGGRGLVPRAQGRSCTTATS